MAIDNAEVIDAVAYEGDKLILQLYDHLEFTDEIEKDHMFLIDFTQFEDIEELCGYAKNHYYYEHTPVFAGRKVGEIRRFRNIKKGDIVLVPCYKGFYIGRATGNFRYDEESKIFWQ